MEAEEVTTVVQWAAMVDPKLTNTETNMETSTEAADMIPMEALATNMDQVHRVLMVPTLPRVKVVTELLLITPIKSLQATMEALEDGKMSVRLREGKLNLWDSMRIVIFRVRKEQPKASAYPKEEEEEGGFDHGFGKFEYKSPSQSQSKGNSNVYLLLKQSFILNLTIV